MLRRRQRERSYDTDGTDFGYSQGYRRSRQKRNRSEISSDSRGFSQRPSRSCCMLSTWKDTSEQQMEAILQPYLIRGGRPVRCRCGKRDGLQDDIPPPQKKVPLLVSTSQESPPASGSSPRLPDVCLVYPAYSSRTSNLQCTSEPKHLLPPTHPSVQHPSAAIVPTDNSCEKLSTVTGDGMVPPCPACPCAHHAHSLEQTHRTGPEGCGLQSRQASEQARQAQCSGEAPLLTQQPKRSQDDHVGHTECFEMSTNERIQPLKEPAAVVQGEKFDVSAPLKTQQLKRIPAGHAGCSNTAPLVSTQRPKKHLSGYPVRVECLGATAPVQVQQLDQHSAEHDRYPTYYRGTVPMTVQQPQCAADGQATHARHCEKALPVINRQPKEIHHRGSPIHHKCTRQAQPIGQPQGWHRYTITRRIVGNEKYHLPDPQRQSQHRCNWGHVSQSNVEAASERDSNGTSTQDGDGIKTLTSSYSLKYPRNPLWHLVCQCTACNNGVPLPLQIPATHHGNTEVMTLYENSVSHQHTNPQNQNKPLVESSLSNTCISNNVARHSCRNVEEIINTSRDISGILKSTNTSRSVYCQTKERSTQTILTSIQRARPYKNGEKKVVLSKEIIDKKFEDSIQSINSAKREFATQTINAIVQNMSPHGILSSSKSTIESKETVCSSFANANKPEYSARKQPGKQILCIRLPPCRIAEGNSTSSEGTGCKRSERAVQTTPLETKEIAVQADSNSTQHLPKTYSAQHSITMSTPLTSSSPDPSEKTFSVLSPPHNVARGLPYIVRTFPPFTNSSRRTCFRESFRALKYNQDILDVEVDDVARIEDTAEGVATTTSVKTRQASHQSGNKKESVKKNASGCSKMTPIRAIHPKCRNVEGEGKAQFVGVTACTETQGPSRLPEKRNWEIPLIKSIVVFVQEEMKPKTTARVSRSVATRIKAYNRHRRRRRYRIRYIESQNGHRA